MRFSASGQEQDVATLLIDGQSVCVQPGQTVLQAARAAGIVIPTLCYHPDLSPVGSCRLCLVRDERLKLEAAACKLPAIAGMVIRTSTPQIVAHRRFVGREKLRLLQLTFHHAAHQVGELRP